MSGCPAHCPLNVLSLFQSAGFCIYDVLYHILSWSARLPPLPYCRGQGTTALGPNPDCPVFHKYQVPLEHSMPLAYGWPVAAFMPQQNWLVAEEALCGSQSPKYLLTGPSVKEGAHSWTLENLPTPGGPALVCGGFQAHLLPWVPSSELWEHWDQWGIERKSQIQVLGPPSPGCVTLRKLFNLFEVGVLSVKKKKVMILFISKGSDKN